MKRVKTVGTVLFMGALLAALSACEKQEGPAEQAGKEFDKAVQETGEKAGETLDKIGEQIEQTGENIQEAE